MSSKDQIQNQNMNNVHVVSLIGKKRSYEEAMGYQNDYEVVQDPTTENMVRNNLWKDAHLEQICIQNITTNNIFAKQLKEI